MFCSERPLYVRQCPAVLVPHRARARRARAVLSGGPEERHAAVCGVVTECCAAHPERAAAHPHHDVYQERDQWDSNTWV